jgi:hypothetical protein
MGDNGYGADVSDMWFDVETGKNQINDAIKSLNTQYQARSDDH